MWLETGTILTLAIMAGLLLDCILGDPAWIGHPVRILGWWAALTEKICRRLVGKGKTREQLAGLLTWCLVLLPAWGLPVLAGLLLFRLHPLAGLIFNSLVVWAAIAPTDLAKHARAVYTALEADRQAGKSSPEAARAAVGWIVGRDVSQLDYSGCARACVESIAESSIDGVAAPLFWTALLGPAAGFAYRAINTMDSLFGHRNQRYQHFGLVAARADDLANYLPARLSSLLAILLAPLAGGSAKAAFRCYLRDRRKHASPNAGHPEAVYAGAFNLRVGGPVRYAEGLLTKAYINPAGSEAKASHIVQALRLMWLQTIASGLVFVVLHWLLT